VFKFASTNPARLLRLDDVGEIAIGKRANLVITDALFGIKHVIFEGEIVK
jgi:N-acetylglucosamine-6-phosphate deacetylase